MATKFRDAYFCGTCWQEVTRTQIMYNCGHCPRCGHSVHGSEHFLRRAVPAPREPMRTGLEPILALWVEGARRLRAHLLACRLRRLPPLDPEVPAVRMKLRELEGLDERGG